MNDLQSMNTAPQGNNNAVTASGETAGQVLSAQVKATIEARFIMAKKMPRDMDIVREKLIKECKRPYACETFIYSKPIGNTKIEGASIRFAESAIRCMGNIAIENNAIYDDDNKKIIRVMAIDIESNSSYYLDVEIEKTVERKFLKKGDVALSKRINSYNQPVYTLRAREDELIIKQNAMISKAIRTIGLRLIPGDIIDECMDIIKQNLAKRDREDPDAAKRKVFDAFASIGVSVDDIKKYLGHAATMLTPAELQDLRGIYQSIKDGELTWQTVILNKEDKPKKDESKELLKKDEKKEIKDDVEDLSEYHKTLKNEFGDKLPKLLALLVSRKSLKAKDTLKDIPDFMAKSIIGDLVTYKEKIEKM